MEKTTSAGERVLPASTGERQARVFLSYPRLEQAFVRKLSSYLEQSDIEAWVDWEDIRPTEDWLKRILSAIESSDVFLFVITPESCRSKICQLEINHATEHRKHIVPVSRRPVPPQELPESIASLQWISLTDEDGWDRNVAALLTAIMTDIEWVSAHTRYLERALEWQRRGRRSADTLRGAGLVEAERWLREADDKTRIPTPIHRIFLQASQKTQRRNRMTLATVFLMACLALLWQGWQKALSDEQAEDSRAEAELSKAVATRKEREAITSEIALDEKSRPSPLNLARRRYLEVLLQRAQNAKLSKTEATLQRLLRQIPPESAQLFLLRADPNRLGVIASQAEDLIFVWYSDRIETYSVSGARLNVNPVRRGRIIWASADIASSGLLYEVEYPDFADKARSHQVRLSGSRRFLPIQPEQEEQEPDLRLRQSEIIGAEREIFLLPAQRGGARSLGLSRRLESIALPGDAQASFTAGFLYRESTGSAAPSREHIVTQRYWNAQTTMNRVRSIMLSANEVEVEPLAYDLRSRTVLFEARASGVQRTYARPVYYQTIWAALLEPSGEMRQWTEKVNYTDQAAFFQRAVPELKRVLELTDVKPRYRPAALTFGDGPGKALLSDKIVGGGSKQGFSQRSTKMAWGSDEIVSAQFTPGGRHVIAIYPDRGIGFYDCSTGKQVRRFVGPDPKVRSVSHSADGRFIFLFEDDGAVTRWDVLAFGPDGWAATQTPEASIPARMVPTLPAF